MIPCRKITNAVPRIHLGIFRKRTKEQVRNMSKSIAITQIEQQTIESGLRLVLGL